MTSRDVRDELDRALANAATTVFDKAAVALARRYADEIDKGDDEVLASLGPKLVSVLVELGLTPKARTEAAGKGGGRGGHAPNELAAWRNRRHTGSDGP